MTKWVQLEDVSELVSKGTTPTSLGREFTNSGIPFLRAEDIQGGAVDLARAACRISPETHSALKRSHLRSGDLLVTIAGTLGRVGFIPETRLQINCNQAVAFVRLKPALVDVRYACYACQSSVVLRPFLKQKKVGTIGNLNLEQLKSVRIPLPPLCEQKRIATILERVDRLRHTSSYALGLSDNFLPAAFLQLFGDPATNPRHFPMEMVGGIFSKQREGAKCGPFGSALKKHEYVPQGIPVWTMENVGENEFREDGCLYITPQKFEELKAYNVQNGDILVSRAGTVGRMGIVETKYPISIIHSNIIRLSLDSTRCLPIYFTVLMTYFADRVGRLKRGQEDAYTFMNTGRLAELRIPVPALRLQQRFAKLVARHERLLTMQRESLRQAEHLFQTLLHCAFGGQL
jgi:type I restriction enzyme S subunit